ncbi:MAG: aminoacetone oxidase family FAD-binding enzyme, partial [SAR324 cluster bacterium]|nr:aminoacetone oxidase family FAD-binding enzyme [SAR324 cluster bacterium]
GLMCAGVAGKHGRSVLVLEHNSKLGRKILASGGGNCNFTNLIASSEDFVSKNPHFPKSALTRYSSNDFIDLVRSYKLDYYEKKLGQLFSNEGSKAVLDLLVSECKKGSVTFKMHNSASKVTRTDIGFSVKAGEQTYSAENLVIATGGLSFTGLGASDFGFRIAAQFGLNLVKTAPALVPFLLGGYKKLSGLALPVEIDIKGKIIADDFLFTHLGFSGPAVLKASLYWLEGEEVTINFLPNFDFHQLIQKAKKTGNPKSLNKLLSPFLPSRFIDFWLEKEVALPPKDLQNLTTKEIELVIQQFQAWTFIPQGTEGFKKAEVTRGGVDTKDLSSKTFEAKKVKGLYFIGEVLDVTGSLGGFNFQWAWSSGVAAGLALANSK